MNGQGLPESEVNEILETVSKLAKDGGLSGIMSSLSGGVQPAQKPTETKTSTDRRIALLQALKPYLGEDRRAAIDKILQFAKLGSMLGNLMPK